MIEMGRGGCTVVSVLAIAGSNPDSFCPQFCVFAKYLVLSLSCFKATIVVGKVFSCNKPVYL